LPTSGHRLVELLARAQPFAQRVVQKTGLDYDTARQRLLPRLVILCNLLSSFERQPGFACRRVINEEVLQRARGGAVAAPGLVELHRLLGAFDGLMVVA